MNDIRGVVKHCAMIQNQLDQVLQTRNKLLQDVFVSSNKPDVYGVGTRDGSSTQDPLYPEGHHKRAELDSQNPNGAAPNASKYKNKNKKTKNAEIICEDAREPFINEEDETKETQNEISISDAETQSGEDEQEPSQENNNATQEEVETKEHDNNAEIDKDKDKDETPQGRNSNKKDKAARKHGKEREPRIQKLMQFPSDAHKAKDDERFADFL